MTTDVSAGASLLASPVRRLIVDTLARRGAMTAAQLGDIIDLHVTTARFHLDQLVAGGLLESRFQKQVGAGRPRKLYAVAPGSLEPSRRDSEGLQVLAELLAESLTAGENGEPLSPAEAGRRWALEHVSDTHTAAADTPGRWLAKVGEMVDVLGDWGYTPEVTTTNGGRTARINLAHCPFLDLARKNPAVVCGIHRGLIAGAMERLGEEEADVSLEPFVAPFLCRAHVTTQTPFKS
jgi:predicted ArsR family transcriptional regulator